MKKKNGVRFGAAAVGGHRHEADDEPDRAEGGPEPSSPAERPVQQDPEGHHQDARGRRLPEVHPADHQRPPRGRQVRTGHPEAGGEDQLRTGSFINITFALFFLPSFFE